MCFSATASFSVAAVTAVIGIVAARKATHPREILLAPRWCAEKWRVLNAITQELRQRGKSQRRVA